SHLSFRNLVHACWYFEKTRIGIRLNVAHLSDDFRALDSLYITAGFAEKFRAERQSGVFVDVNKRLSMDFARRRLRLRSLRVAILQRCASGLLFFADEFNALESIEVCHQLTWRHPLMNLEAGCFGRQLRILVARGCDAVLDACVFEVNQIRTVRKFERETAVASALRDIGLKRRNPDGFVSAFCFGCKDYRCF